MKFSLTGRYLLGLGFSLAVLNLTTATAATLGWTNTVSGLWRVDTNWTPNALPDQLINNVIVITNADTKTVTIDAATASTNLEIQRLSLSAPSGFTNTLALVDVTTSNPLRVAQVFTVDRGGALYVTNSAIIPGAAGTFDINAGSATMDGGLIDCSTHTVRIGRTNGYTGTFDLNGGTMLAFKVSVGSGLSPASVTEGILNVAGGALIASSVFSVGETPNATGTASMTSGQIIATNDLTKIGNAGHGTMNISGGTATFAFLSVADNNNGTLNLTGGQLLVNPRTTNDWTRVGNFGSGQFNISGGTAVLRGELHLSDNLGVTGSLSMIGGQLFTTNDLTAIGRRGFGEMTISNATAVSTNVSVGRHDGAEGLLTLLENGSFYALADVSIGRFANSVGHVVVNGGLLSLTSETLWVGREGTGDLTISNGTIRAKNLYVGMSPDNTNRPYGSTIIAGGSVQLSSNLVVGTALFSTGQVSVVGGNLTVTNSSRPATLVIASGDFTLNAGAVTVDTLVLATNTGSFTFGGGTLQAKGMVISNGAPFVVGDGVNSAVLQLEGGTFSFADGLVISANSTVTGCGTIIGPITNNGTLATNCAAAAISITGTAKSNSTVTVSFTTIASSNHVLEFKTNLADTGWSAILPGIIGDGSVMSKADTDATNDTRFYRIHLQ